MKEFSKEEIEIDGKVYTLFINRKAIVSWENITKVSKIADKLSDKYKDAKKTIESNEPIEVKDGDNPFDYADSERLGDIEEDEKAIREIYIKFYWIALYENNQLSLSDTTSLFEKAEEEYGIEKLIELANQMVQSSNTNKFGNKEIKKLTALHQAN